MRAPFRLTGGAADAAIAAGVAAVQLGAEPVFAAAGGVQVPVAAPLLLALGAGSLAVLSRFPLLTALGVGLCTPLYYVLGPVDAWTAWIMFVVGVVRLGATGHRVSAVSATVVLLLVIAAGELVQFEPERTLFVVGWALVVLAAGEITRNRRAYLREAERRAAEAERTREEEARRRATEERLRIARELHDVIAHNISLINVQAGAAVHNRDPEQAYAALEAIRQASRSTLRELRSTLGVLRQVDEDAAPVAPAPSLERLDDLAAQTTEAGLPVRCAVAGEPAPLPAPVDLAGYRIVQEALTNALRHAAGATGAEVELRYGDGEVVLRIEDDGRAPEAAPHEGNGLRGMRERAAAVGGEVTAGPRPGGGFAVRAVLPVDGGGGTPDGRGAGTDAGRRTAW